MAESTATPWTLASHPDDVAACSGAVGVGVTAGQWADPELAALVAPPVTVSAAGVRAPGRHRLALAPFPVPVPAPIPVAERLPTWRDLAGALAPA
ncbi:hypothetical protein [Hamadaea tsunoensis]|uniref:hypothetical protein n=1 Tax=Hamadaea tsunoensis TaxID=53368 RepID=UPI00040B7845|nr:hypothetical protein [Hamadaea tsunoensis]